MPALLPAVPDLGMKITMPRKTNRAAAKAVASGDRFWDKRKVAAKARKRALEIERLPTSRQGARRLTRKQKQWLENHLRSWSWATPGDALQAPAAATQEQLDELVAATRLPYVERAVLKVQGLCLEQIRYVAERAPQTVLFVLVDPLAMSQQGTPPGLTQTAQSRVGSRPSIHPHSAEIITEMISVIISAQGAPP